MTRWSFFLCFIVYIFCMPQPVKGHGFVHSVLAGGKSYPGWNPFVDPYNNAPPRIVRKVLNDGFVANTDPDIACHHGGNDGTSVIASAPSGSQLIFQWAYWPADHQGPVSTYMTSCNGNCNTFAANNARWFKIDADGYEPTSKQWAAARLIANNNSWTSSIPVALAPGEYLVRNEIIALHSSTPQFYPSCSQIKVTGTGTGVPSDNELVLMQTLYDGFIFPDIYGTSVSFTVPGPPPVTFGGGGGSSPQPSSTAPSQSGAGIVSSLTPTSTRPTRQCKLNMTPRKLVRRKSVQ